MLGQRTITPLTRNGGSSSGLLGLSLCRLTVRTGSDATPDLACSRFREWSSGGSESRWEWPARRPVEGYSENGADLALLSVLTDDMPRRYERVVIASGDGISADETARLTQSGVHTTVVSHECALSARLGWRPPRSCSSATWTSPGGRMMGAANASSWRGVTVEDPDDLLRRLRLGREEYCQRLLTQLILGGPYPRWNTRSRPSEEGRRFLTALDELSFGAPPRDLTDPVFVDELDLGKRPSDLQGSAPDYGVFTSGRLWIVELKTERGSHRDAQLPTYAGTARHHHPDLRIDVTYLTGPMPTYSPELEDGVGYAHLTWEDVLPLLEQVWGGGSEVQRASVRRLEEVVDALGTPWASWRGQRIGGAVATPPADPVTDAVALARLTANDREQRALDFIAGSLEELRQVGRDVLEALARIDDRTVAHVRPWLWNAATTDGRPLSAAGQEVGYELRVSRYQKPQR